MTTMHGWRGERFQLLKKNLLELPNEGEYGYIIQCDISIPKSLHRAHSDFGFLCENKVPPLEGSKHSKLLITLEDKKDYVIHFVALKQALQHGLILQKIHRAIRFRQKAYLKPLIELSAQLRKEAKGNPFYQTATKLICNSVFGKFLESPLKRKIIKLVTKPEQLNKLVSRANFKSTTSFAEDLVAVHMKKTKVNFNRPVIVGFSILELSKVHMYEFYQDVLLTQYSRENISLIYMDTDSFVFYFETEDRYKDMLQNLHFYDTSNFQTDHPCFSSKNEKKTGTFKDETAGEPISHFISLKSKVYAYRLGEKQDLRVKGLQNCVARKTLNFDHFYKVLMDNIEIYRDTRRIQSDKHTLYSFQTRKKALCGFDDKRVVLKGNIKTLPYGHIDLLRKRGLEGEDSGNEDESIAKYSRKNDSL